MAPATMLQRLHLAAAALLRSTARPPVEALQAVALQLSSVQCHCTAQPSYTHSLAASWQQGPGVRFTAARQADTGSTPSTTACDAYSNVNGHGFSSSTPGGSQSISCSTRSFSSAAAAAPAADEAVDTKAPALGFVRGGHSVADFPLNRVRNFGIIAHIDHGKSTLADRLMQMTGAISAGAKAQYLDKLQVERERGITVKAQTASLVYSHSDGHDYLLNLIDTPGHVDFSYEVSRSLAACQGALLLVDASQGVQAQTVATFFLAFEQGLDLVPIINKVDLPSAEPNGVAQQLASAFDMTTSDSLRVSAKTGLGLDDVLSAVVERISPPRGDPNAPLRLLLFDTYYDEYRGVVCLVEVVDGALKQGDRLTAMASGQDHDALEVGILAPEPHPTGALLTGQVGYLITGLKDLKAARVGDTWHAVRRPVVALPGFRPAKALVFAGIYPASGDEYEALANALDKLQLTDASVAVKKENSDALGAGFRCGFLGMLHLEVFMQRLQQEHGAAVVTTTPTVPYEVELAGGERRSLQSASEYPHKQKVVCTYEPTVHATIVAPSEHLGAVMQLCTARRGEQLEYSYIGGASVSRGNSSSGGAGGFESLSSMNAGSGDAGSGGGAALGDRVVLRYRLPLSELAGDFYSRLKSVTHGYASFDYEEGKSRPADLQRLDILINGEVVDALARMVHASEAERLGRALCEKLGGLLERQQFEVVIQAAANGRVIAREQIRAMRKNVLAKCYGGDVTRKRKLLERQKEGKARMRKLGSVSVPIEVFPELMKTTSR